MTKHTYTIQYTDEEPTTDDTVVEMECDWCEQRYPEHEEVEFVTYHRNAWVDDSEDYLNIKELLELIHIFEVGPNAVYQIGNPVPHNMIEVGSSAERLWQAIEEWCELTGGPSLDDINNPKQHMNACQSAPVSDPTQINFWFALNMESELRGNELDVCEYCDEKINE